MSLYKYVGPYFKHLRKRYVYSSGNFVAYFTPLIVFVSRMPLRRHYVRYNGTAVDQFQLYISSLYPITIAIDCRVTTTVYNMNLTRIVCVLGKILRRRIHNDGAVQTKHIKSKKVDDILVLTLDSPNVKVRQSIRRPNKTITVSTSIDILLIT